MESCEAGGEEEDEELEPVSARDTNIQPDTVVIPLGGGQATDPLSAKTTCVHFLPRKMKPYCAFSFVTIVRQIVKKVIIQKYEEKIKAAIFLLQASYNCQRKERKT